MKVPGYILIKGASNEPDPGPVHPFVLALRAARDEAQAAEKLYPDGLRSSHEAHSVLKEEYDELWDEIKVKSSRRDAQRMRHEAIQVAATALRIAAMCDEEGWVNK